MGVNQEIRQEFRSALRLLSALNSPISHFLQVPDRREDEPRYYVQFDLREHRRINGLRIGSKQLVLPDERLLDLAYEFSKCVWHLKDRLKQWCIANGGRAQLIETYAEQHPDLLICADVANRKKHAQNKNRSGLDPRLGTFGLNDKGQPQALFDTVRFDTSKSGVFELFYSGSSKEKELIVSHAVPISFTIDVISGDGKRFIGDAIHTFERGLIDWVDLNKAVGFLRDDEQEGASLVGQLDILVRKTP